MSIAKLKRSLHDKKKTREAIQSLIATHYQATDELRALYKGMTGECYRADCASGQRKCFDCEQEERAKGASARNEGGGA